MNDALIDRLQTDLEAAGYRAGSVSDLLGDAADSARQRGVFAPARRILAERETSPLAILIRVLLLGDTVAADTLTAALPTLTASGAAELGLVAPKHEGVRAALSLNPVRMRDARSATPLEWWILSDLDDQLRLGPARPDHVMGVGGATRSLIAQAPVADAPRSLDLGTGCGIVAMHLSLRGEVIATDISERALRLARANARLNGVADRIEFRQGDLFAPVVGENFDLILSNPPFVITPRGDDTPVYEYRDGGLSGDELAARVVREAPQHLAAGGTMLCLGNWESPWGQNGLSRVRGWIDAAAGTAGSLDAWIIERDRVDVAQYAETWARDGGARVGTPEFEALISGWLADFGVRRVIAVGLGSIRIRRAPEGSAGVVKAEQVMGAFAAEAPGAGLAAAFDAGVQAQRMSAAEMLATRWVRDDAVVEEREFEPGEEAPRAIVLATDRPIARRISADTLLAAAVGVCDGELDLGQTAEALSTILEIDAGAASDALVAGIRELAWCGMVAPAGR